MESVLFALLAMTATGASVALIASRNPIYSAMFMVVVFVATGVMFVLLAAPFIAAVQVIVYAGAIVVLFLFVISYLSGRSEGLRERRAGVTGLALLLALLLAGELIWAATTVAGGGGLLPAGGAAAAGAAGASGAAAAVAVPGTVESVARLLFADYVVPFEITSVLLLVAMVGAIVLGRRLVRPSAGEERR